MREPFQTQDAKYLEFKQKHPHITYAQYVMERQHQRLLDGKTTNRSGALAIALAEPAEFWKAGEVKAANLFRSMSLAPHNRVIEYGCGSLRVAAHFVRYLDRGCFFGLDVISGFFEIGKTMLGAELLEQKAPRLEIIGEATLEMAADFHADCIYSNTVCVHVHPDETGAYFRNLMRLAHLPGARLFFNASVSNRPVRFENDSWAWPLDFYKQSLGELELIRAATGRPRDKAGEAIAPANFEFRRR
jgi:SAM-dependent methyltransferase